MPQILDWAADEGWNPGLDDAAAFYAADPQGFFVKTVNDEPVSAISVVNHSDAFAFLGLYLCHPLHRGQGHGIDVWNAALKHAGNRTVGLDGVPDQQANYRKSGFVLHGQTTRWQGRFDGRSGASPRPLDAADICTIANWDRRQNGFDRRNFLPLWLSNSKTRQSLVIERDGRIVAYGTIRQCRAGCKIGPFAANNLKDAQDLLCGLAGVFGNSSEVMIDVPKTSTALSEILAAAGFAPGFETARMYVGKPPTQALAVYSAMATLELG